MPRPRERVCLQDGLKLDLNRLARQGFVRRGANIGSRGIRWTHSYWGEIANGTISADMSGKDEGWFRIQLGSLDQRIILLPRARHFGGRQWYFMCPVRNRPVSVLWKPNGATRFCSRQTWGRQVAYQSQFNDAINRAHAAKARIKSRLIADLDPDEWDLPPKPKWMRWATYNRYSDRHDRYEDVLDHGLIALAWPARLDRLQHPTQLRAPCPITRHKRWHSVCYFVPAGISVRPREYQSGWPRARPISSRCRTFMWCTHCRRRSPTSPIRTRR